MIPKVLFPRWDDLSSQQKTLVKEWADSLIKVEANRQKLSESLFNNNNENQSASVDDFSNDFSFEIVDSLTTSEGIKIEQIISSLNLKQDNCKAACATLCTGHSSPHNCIQTCIENNCAG